MPAGRVEGKSELLSELIKQGVITEEQANNYRDRKTNSVQTYKCRNRI